MTLATDEFIRRFLSHVLPKGFHRIRHYGLFAKASCADNIAWARELLAGPKPQREPADADVTAPNHPSTPCPCRGGRMRAINHPQTQDPSFVFWMEGRRSNSSALDSGLLRMFRVPTGR
jgi:hypothetical protein